MIIRIIRHRGKHGAFGRGGPGFGVLDLLDGVCARVDGGIVLKNHFVALLGVGLLCSGLHVFNGLIRRDDVGKLEEGGLHDRVDAVAHAGFLGKLDGVDVVELDVVLCNRVLQLRRKLLFHLLERPLGVKQERAAFLDAVGHIIMRDIGRVVAGHEVSRVDQIRALDGRLAEAEVGNRKAAGLLGVIGEVALRIHVGMVADDLDGVLVRADGAVRTEAVELAGDGAFRRRVDLLLHIEGGEGYVVDDADGEVVLLRAIQVIEHSLRHGGREFLGTEAIAAAEDHDVMDARFRERADDVLIERLAEGTGFLGAVEHRDLLAGLGQSGNELIGRERTIQANLDQAELCALCVEVVDGLFHNIRAGAHGYDDLVRIGRADVVEQVVLASGDLADFVHVMLNDGRDRFIIFVAGFAVLEVDVRVLRAAAQVRMLRVQGAGTEGRNRIAVKQLIHVLIIDRFDLLNLVGGTEAVKEMHEGNAALDGGKVRHKRKVHNFLHGSGSKHGKAGLAAAHHVAVIAEDGERMVCKRTRGNMEHAGQELAGDLVHVRDHQQKALGSGEGGRQSARGKRAVHGARSTGFGLHLSDAYLLAEQVQPAVGRPVVCNLRHRGRRGDGIYRGHVGKRICDVRSSGIAIDCHGLCHLGNILLCHIGLLYYILLLPSGYAPLNIKGKRRP